MFLLMQTFINISEEWHQFDVHGILIALEIDVVHDIIVVCVQVLYSKKKFIKYLSYHALANTDVITNSEHIRPSQKLSKNIHH